MGFKNVLRGVVSCLWLLGSSSLASSGLSAMFPEWTAIPNAVPLSVWSDVLAFEMGSFACDPDHVEIYRYQAQVKFESVLKRFREGHFLVAQAVISAYAKQERVLALVHLVPVQASNEYILVLNDYSTVEHEVWLCRVLTPTKSPAHSSLFNQSLFVDQSEVSTDDARGKGLIPIDFVNNWYGDNVRCVKRETLAWHEPTLDIKEILDSILLGREYQRTFSDSKHFDVMQWTDKTNQHAYLENSEQIGTQHVMSWCQLEVIGQPGVLPVASAPSKTKLIVVGVFLILVVAAASVYVLVRYQLDGTIFAMMFVIGIVLVMLYTQFLIDQL
jgi:hypothetical protein